MEKKITDREWELAQLLETKDFDLLSTAEQQFVLNEMSETEYSQRRKVLVQSSTWTHNEIPLPLILADEKSRWMIPIPLYQSIAAVAAVFLLTFFLFRSNGTMLAESYGNGLVAIDTVYVEKRITDTIVEYDTKYIERIIVKNESPSEESVQPMRSITQDSRKESPTSNRELPSLPDLSELSLENKGKSAMNDETFGLLEGYSLNR